METELLSTLNDIKIAIYLLLFVVILGVIANWIRAGISLKNVVRTELENVFNEEASNLYDEGRYDSLLEHCREKLKKKPNHAYALWYMAKAYYQKGEFDEAKEYFSNLAKSEPSWEDSHIKPYLAKIEATEDESR